MKEVNIEKLKLARAARIKVREHIQEAFGSLEQLDQVISKFSNRYHPRLDEIDYCVTKLEDSLELENKINTQMIDSIELYLGHKFYSDEEMAELEKEVNNIKLC